jgi:AAA15 family ATPase/GTPase
MKITIICGKPDSGKSALIKSMLELEYTTIVDAVHIKDSNNFLFSECKPYTRFVWIDDFREDKMTYLFEFIKGGIFKVHPQGKESFYLTAKLIIETDISLSKIEKYLTKERISRHFEVFEVKSCSFGAKKFKPIHNTYFDCDICGKEKKGRHFAVYNENHVKQAGLKKCESCYKKEFK